MAASAPSSAAASPVSATCSFGVFTSLLSRFVCQGGRRSSRNTRFEQRHVVPYRRAAELERRGQIADVEQPGSLARCERQQPRQRLQRADAGQISHVALDQGIQIVVIPLRAPPARWTRQRRRIAARDNPFRQQLSQPRTPFERESAAAQGVEEVGHAPFTLALRQRMQSQGLQASRQRVGERRHEQDLTRAGQQEASRRPMPIDCHLHGCEGSLVLVALHPGRHARGGRPRIPSGPRRRRHAPHRRRS